MASLPSLDGQFDKAIHAEFWHYMAKHRTKPTAYSKQTVIDERMAAITKSLGSCSFDTATGPNEWTPAHVAVLAGNEAGLQFLLSKNARLDLRDSSGKTAIDFAEQYHPELLPYLRPFHAAFQSRRELCAQIVAPLCTPPVLGNFSYDPDTDDFGVDNRGILFCRDLDATSVNIKSLQELADQKGIDMRSFHVELRTDHLIQDMVSVGKYEGFRVDTTRHIYYPRDHYTKAFGGALVATSSQHPKEIDLSLQRGTSMACYFSNNASFQTTHDLFKGAQIGSSSKQKDALLECSWLRTEENPQELRFFMECGDKFLLTNAFGEKVLLIGEQHLPVIHSYCRLTKLFDDKGITLIIPKDVSDERALKAAEEMYALGLLKIDGQTALLDREQLTQLVQKALRENRTDYRAIAIEMGFYKPFKLSKRALSAAQPMIATYLAQKEIVQELLARSFGVKNENVIAVPNCGYHLDTVMAPAPNGHMFLYDPDTTIKVIQSLQSECIRLNLSEKDRTLLDQYLAAAMQLKRELGPLFERAEKVLATAGIPIIKTPGIFFDVSQSREYPLTSNVHFMNPVTGWSEKTRAYYYITTGTSVGDQLGPVLMDLYAQFLEQHIPGIHVHYVGRNPKNPKDFSQAMQLYNIRGGSSPQAGIHCCSFPMNTEGHEHKGAP